MECYQKFKGITPRKRERKKINTNNSALTGLKVFSPARKIIDCYEDYIEGNFIYAAGMGLRAVNDSPRDLIKIKDSFIPDKNYDPEYQKPFKLLHQSLIAKTKIGKWLHKYDINLFNTKKAEFLLVKIGMKDYSLNKDGHIKIEGSALAKLVGGTALRIPVLGVALYMIIGTDGVVKAKTNKERAKELGKDIVNAISIWTVAGLLGCIGRHYGKLADLIFMGTGFVLGRMLAKKINEKIFGNFYPDNPKSFG